MLLFPAISNKEPKDLYRYSALSLSLSMLTAVAHLLGAWLRSSQKEEMTVGT
jgi:hypothetical protein